MRMWMIDPRLLCRKHLLGEHGEIHKHRHNFVKRHKIDGRLSPIVLIEPASMKTRHDELANEMILRGYNHKSPYELPDLSYLPLAQQSAKANVRHNLRDLSSRCAECKKWIDLANKSKVLPTKHKLFRKLHREHGIILNTEKMHSFRRRGFGSRVVSWATVGQEQDYQSFETMATCLKYPTKLVRDDRTDKVITIEIDLDKVKEVIDANK